MNIILSEEKKMLPKVLLSCVMIPIIVALIYMSRNESLLTVFNECIKAGVFTSILFVFAGFVDLVLTTYKCIEMAHKWNADFDDVVEMWFIHQIWRLDDYRMLTPEKFSELLKGFRKNLAR